MCTGVNDQDFVTIHHELGHNYYQRAYRDQDPLYRTTANDGSTKESETRSPSRLRRTTSCVSGLLDRLPPDTGDIGLLLRPGP